MVRRARTSSILVFAAALAGGCNSLLGIERRAYVASNDGSAGELGDASADLAAPDEGTETSSADPCAGPTLDLEVGQGNPSWTLASAAVYLGRRQDSVSSFSSVWKEKHEYDARYGLFRSSVAHAGPYGDELPAGLAQAHFLDTGCIDTAGASDSKEVLFSAILVPSASAPEGASFENATRGPVVVGPLRVDVLILRADQPVDHFAIVVPKASDLYTSAAGLNEGYRHVILSWTSELLTFRPGSYRATLTITDLVGAQTRQSMRFVMQ